MSFFSSWFSPPSLRLSAARPVVLCSLVLATSDLTGQSLLNDNGFLPVRNYAPKEYASEPQIWTVVQDHRGIMYFGNKEGILEYDGVSWQLIPTSNLSQVRSLAADSSGRIYVGAYNELGYLSVRSDGRTEFISMVNSIGQQYRDFDDVWGTFIVNGEVLFHTSRYLFRFSGAISSPPAPDAWSVQVWTTNTQFYRAFVHHNKLHIYEGGYRLRILDGDSLKTPADHEKLADLKTIWWMSHLRADPEDTVSSRTLVLDFRTGLYIYDGVSPVPFPSEINSLLIVNLADMIVTLPDGRFCVQSRRGGVFLFDEQMNLTAILNKEYGLQDESVYDMFPDRWGGLWITTSKGISRVELHSPLTHFDDRLGLSGICRQMVTHDRRQYVTTNQGLYYRAMENAGGVRGRRNFVLFPGMNVPSMGLISAGSSLFVTRLNGVFEIKGENLNTVSEERAYGFRESRRDSNLIYVTSLNGLHTLYRDDATGKWSFSGPLPAVNSRINQISEEDDGTLWLSAAYEGLIRVRYTDGKTGNPTTLRNVSVQYYDTTNGLPDMVNNEVFLIRGETVFTTSAGLYRFDEQPDRFVPDTLLQVLFRDGWQIADMAETSDGRVWILLEKGFRFRVGYAESDSKRSFSWSDQPAVRLSGSRYELIPDPSGIVWLAGIDGLIRYDPGRLPDRVAPFSAMIRRVDAGRQVLSSSGSSGTSTAASVEYESNDLSFRCAAPFFDDESATMFRYLLEGFDAVWSDWTNEPKRDYTNVPEGNYTFRVEARNVYGSRGLTDSFHLGILPPLYRSVWANVLYALSFAGIILGLVRWRSAQLEKDKRHLEQLVRDRTEEVAEKNRQLEDQAMKLRELDHVKSRFFANISHEFRTPLTLIIDPLREIMAGRFRGNLKGQSGVMLRNARRLLRLINQLLDLSKLDSGGMNLHATKGDLVSFLRDVAGSFESRGLVKGIHLSFSSDQDRLEIHFDREKLEQVFYNLLSNALKFTGREGSVTIVLTVPHSDSADGRFVTVTVQDTGIGIHHDHLPHIFDRFYQVDGSHIREHEGTGIGLAIVKELIELHHGSVSVASREGAGTSFTIRLPIGIDHFHPGEISDEPPADHRLLDEADEEWGAIREAAEPERRSTLERPEVLVVEDNRDVREHIRSHLEPDYSIVEAGDGKEGMEYAFRRVPDLVVSDLMMPVMDGFALCKVLKEDIRTNHIPVILLTARAEEEDRIRGLEQEADDYLTKPFSSEELRVRIRNLISLRRKLQEKHRLEFLAEPSAVSAVSMDEKFLKNVVTAVERNIDNPDLTIEGLARGVAMSRYNLHRKIRALTGQSPNRFVRSIRLKRAAHLLRENADTVTRVAYEVGFNNLAYFARCFREEFGVLPSEFSRRAAGEDTGG